TTCVTDKKKIADVTCADVASVRAVDFVDPPKGQDYNGPFQLLFRDSFV
ncbi:MAG: hypothetical protein K0R38_6706, partial [Polyangiaceae bacterium]|nr:hypothetical protein [Polyangiaceae bacterium]